MKRGGQPGNNNASKGKPWRDAIDWVLANKKIGQVAKAQALRGIAEKLCEKALEGDIQAMKEIGDRLDGKSNQSITADVSHKHHIGEMSTYELERIASAGSTGTTKEKGSTKESDSVH